MRRTGLLLFVVLLGLVFSFGKRDVKAQNQVFYNVVDLGSVGGSMATDMNEAGQITGTVSETRHGFVYIPGVGLTHLPPMGDNSWGLKINDSGQVMGRYIIGNVPHTFIYTPGMGISDIGKLVLDEVVGVDMNANGQITGTALMSENWVDGRRIVTSHAFLYSPGHGMMDLDSYNSNYSFGIGINVLGQVTGWIVPPMIGTVPLLYTPGEGLALLRPTQYVGGGRGEAINNNGWVTGYTFEYVTGHLNETFLYVPGQGMIASGMPGSYGRLINNSGQVVGVLSTQARPEYGCFLWAYESPSVHSIVGLGNLGTEYCSPRSMNDSGQVVGMAKLADGSLRAFLYKDGAMQDLNSLIPADFGMILEFASKVNNKGWIIGTGNKSGTRSVLLIPKITSAGANVVATPVDTNGHGIPVTITFENVLTPGETTLWAAEPSPYGWGFSLTTTATYSGNVTTCINYTQANFPKGSGVVLMHYENGEWKNITSSLDTEKNIVCGISSSLSPFLVTPYNFSGFFAPIENGGLNTVKTGSAVPFKFKLGANWGLDILYGTPSSKPIDCNSSVAGEPVEETVTAGASSLTYDAVSSQYVYVWKTDKSWAGTCRQFVMTLKDGTPHTANFSFTR